MEGRGHRRGAPSRDDPLEVIIISRHFWEMEESETMTDGFPLFEK